MADGLHKYLTYLFVSGFTGLIKFSWSLTIASHTAYVFISCVKESFRCKQQQSRKEAVFSEVLFFPDTKLACRNFLSVGGCSRLNCPFAHEETSLSKLIDILTQAQHTLDVCVFTINCHELANAVVELHRKGVVVRVLTDDEQLGSTGSQIEKFRKEGIQVRHDLSSFFMHHKFVIVDEHLLANGSFNWTRQAVTGNRENVVITNEPNIVNRFTLEFGKLWLEYDPSRR